jgi:hypothetical protein
MGAIALRRTMAQGDFANKIVDNIIDIIGRAGKFPGRPNRFVSACSRLLRGAI